MFSSWRARPLEARNNASLSSSLPLRALERKEISKSHRERGQESRKERAREKERSPAVSQHLKIKSYVALEVGPREIDQVPLSSTSIEVDTFPIYGSRSSSA